MTVKLNSSRQLGLFEENGIGFKEAIDIARESILTQAHGYKHLVLGYSGGKDSTALVSLMAYFIESRQVPFQPQDVTVVYSDTGQELPPLHDHAVNRMLPALRARGFETLKTGPKPENRFYVNMLGRGLPTPGGVFRWCVGQLKVNPTEEVVKKLHRRYGGQDKLLVLTGVRKGESAVRDERLYTVCSKDGECGTGAWQPSTPKYDLLAPLLNWRTCHIFDWLAGLAREYGIDHGLPTGKVAKIYGMQDIRTGCNGCPVASRDYALEYAINNVEGCQSLKPLLRLRELWEIYRTRRDFRHHNDGTGPVRAKDLGPLTIPARQFGYKFLAEIQRDIYRMGGTYQLLSFEERALIRWHWKNKTMPKGWDGSQPVGNARQLLPQGQSEMELFGE